jgi:hypothetical protein
MVFVSTRELTDTSAEAYAANMAQVFLVFLLVTVFVSQLVTTQRQKFTEELDGVISRIGRVPSDGVAGWEQAVRDARFSIAP